MIILLNILFVFSFILLLINFILYGSLNRVFRFEKVEESNCKISVIVAAKNEEKRIGDLIDALQKQNYPEENFEIIFVDDNSTDNTYKIITEASTKFKNVFATKVIDKVFPGKKGALDCGIKKANNPYILITDADCIPQPTWIKSFADKFIKGNDFVFGIAPYRKSNSFTNLITQFENLRAHILMFSFTKLGAPYSAAARSFGFSKEAFNKISGYENTTDTLSGDDDLLLREAIKNNFTIGMVTDPKSFVFTESKQKYSDYVKQKSRHTSTSIHYSLKIKILLALWHLLNIITLFSAILIPFNILFVFPFFIKLVVDIFLLNNFQNDFGYKINPLWYIFLQIIYELNLIYFFINGLKFKNRWE